PLADDKLFAAVHGPQLHYTHATERLAVDLDDRTVHRRQADAVDPDRRIGYRIAHQGYDAGVTRTRAENAAGVKAQCVVDRGRQLGRVDAARLRQIAFADGAVQRQCCTPDAEHEFEPLIGALLQLCCNRAAPLVQRIHGSRLGHAFDFHEPIEAVAVRAATVTVVMIGIDAARRVWII